MDHVDKIAEQWRRERPDIDTAPMALVGRIKQLSQILTREMEKTWVEFGLNGASFDVLATLRRSGAPYQLSPGDLLQSTMVTSGTMTNRIDQLVKADLVERIKNPEDGRGFLIALTDKGIKLIDAAVTAHVETLDRLVSSLSKDEMEVLNTGVKGYLSSVQKTQK